MTKPPVSVIIAVKNGEKFIESAIKSVLAQTYAPVEILAVDGRSTDKTREILKKFDQVNVTEQRGIGIGNAYNTGISAARGEFIAFLSSDDFWLPEKIEKQISVLSKRPSALFAVCQAEFFLHDAKFTPPGFRAELLDAPRVAYIMETLCARRAAFDEIGFFDENLRTSEDVDWFARALDLSVESVAVPEVLLRKRIHDKNLHLDSVKNNRDLLCAVKNTIDRKRNLRMQSPDKI